MLIDPFTVIAQIVNFALLVWLLQRFLYGPVMRAMQAREARIRDEVEGARRLRAEAEAAKVQYGTLLAGFEAEREALASKAQAEVDAVRNEQIRQARADVKDLRERWNRALEQEKEAFLRALRQQVGRGSMAVMRRALKELADDDLEDRFIKRFAERLRVLTPEDRERLSGAARQEGATFLIRTAFPLSDAQRAALIEMIEETFDGESAPRFETNPDFVAGVELRAGGLKVAWTLDGYLEGLEEAMREAFHETAQSVRAHDDA